jgi:Zn finger protein HypA/HybF involved in hydrogenase expression
VGELHEEIGISPVKPENLLSLIVPVWVQIGDVSIIDKRQFYFCKLF